MARAMTPRSVGLGQSASQPGTSTPSMAPTIHLEHWSNSLAPLSDSQKVSVSRLSNLVAHRRRPARPSSQQQLDDAHPTRSHADDDAPTSRGLAYADTASSIASSQTTTLDLAHKGPSRTEQEKTSRFAPPQLPASAVIDAPSFASWFADVSSHMAASTQSSYVQALQELTHAANEVEDMLQHLETARVHVAELRAGVKFAHEGSQGLKEEAEAMVERLDNLSSLSDALSLRLSYFSILPSATSFLSSPSLSLVLSPDFLHTLDRLDVGLAFLAAHAHFKDAPLYRMRFEHCLVRAGQLVRMWTTQRWRDLGADTTQRIKEWEKSRYAGAPAENAKRLEDEEMMELADPVLHTLVFSRFSQEAPQFRPLLAELERRSAPNAPAAASLLRLGEETADPKDESKLLADYADERGEEEKETGGQTEEEEEGGPDDVQRFDAFASPEFATLLAECRDAYVEGRRGLIQGVVASCIARIEAATQNEAAAVAASVPARRPSDAPSRPPVPAASALVQFASKATRFLMAVCEQETSLYAGFFDVGVAASSEPDADQRDGGGRRRDGRAHARPGKQAEGLATARLAAIETLRNFLLGLAAPLTDRLRPRLQRETNVAILSEVCRVLLSYSEESCAATGAGATTAKSAPPASSPGAASPPQLSRLSSLLLLEHLLGEAQSCLSARASLLIEGAELRNYQPKGGETDYPARLGGKRAREENRHRRSKSSVGGAGLLGAAAAAADGSVDSATGSDAGGMTDADASSPRIVAAAMAPAAVKVRLFSMPPASVVRTWYPTLSRTLTLLGLLHDALTSDEFESLARRSIDACLASLGVGAERMRAQRGFTTAGGGGGAISERIDPDLFLIRHLLLLREVAASVRLATAGSRDRGAGCGNRADRARREMDACARRRRRTYGNEEGAGAGATLAATTASVAGVVDLSALSEAVNALWRGGSAWLSDPRSLVTLGRRRAASATSPQTRLVSLGGGGAAPREAERATRGSAEVPGAVEASPSAPSASSASLERVESELSAASAHMIDQVVRSVVLPLRIFRDQHAAKLARDHERHAWHRERRRTSASASGANTRGGGGGGGGGGGRASSADEAVSPPPPPLLQASAPPLPTPPSAAEAGGGSATSSPSQPTRQLGAGVGGNGGGAPPSPRLGARGDEGVATTTTSRLASSLESFSRVARANLVEVADALGAYLGDDDVAVARFEASVHARLLEYYREFVASVCALLGRRSVEEAMARLGGWGWGGGVVVVGEGDAEMREGGEAANRGVATRGKRSGRGEGREEGAAGAASEHAADDDDDDDDDDEDEVWLAVRRELPPLEAVAEMLYSALPAAAAAAAASTKSPDAAVAVGGE